jgi:hypothetical protein
VLRRAAQAGQDQVVRFRHDQADGDQGLAGSVRTPWTRSCSRPPRSRSATSPLVSPTIIPARSPVRGAHRPRGGRFRRRWTHRQDEPWVDVPSRDTRGAPHGGWTPPSSPSPTRPPDAALQGRVEIDGGAFQAVTRSVVTTDVKLPAGHPSRGGGRWQRLGPGGSRGGARMAGPVGVTRRSWERQRGGVGRLRSPRRGRCDQGLEAGHVEGGEVEEVRELARAHQPAELGLRDQVDALARGRGHRPRARQLRRLG